MLKRIPTILQIGLFAALFNACSSEKPVSTSGSPVGSPASGIIITTLSTQAWLVTGGDALVQVSLTAGLDLAQLTVSLNGVDVTAEFKQTSPLQIQAVLTSLPEGDSTLTASLGPAAGTETLALTNYPISGPIISGRPEQPFVCQTGEFKLVTGGILGTQLDTDCSVLTRVDYVYWSDSESAFKTYRHSPMSEPPEDMGEITGPDGNSMAYIVRVETGTVNRGIYEIAMLHDPADGEVGPWNRSPHWNGKLVYTHGGGCRGGWFQQGDRTGGVMRHGLFELGYAVISATLNVFGQNCNDLLASETHIMVKERFIEHYGAPAYTIATGASGGSYQSHQTADNYPGVFDGIIVGLSFPDVTSATIFTLADARLLNHYFTDVNAENFTLIQQTAVAGFGSWGSIMNLSRGAARLDPIYQFETSPEEQGGEISIAELENLRYDRHNPTGIRPSVYDHTVNVYGRVAQTQIARRPLDNVGVQYGLAALNDEVITPRQFIDLNRDIGGFDRDMNHVPSRHRADVQASRRALESGRILYGGAGLASTPIIDYRSYTDHAEDGDIHMIVHQFSTRARLRAANGHFDNQVMQVGGRWGYTEDNPDMRNIFQEMDRWIMGIKNDNSDIDPGQKVIANKPVTLIEACWDNSGETRVKIEQEQSFDGNSRCNELYPAYPTPRIAAGATLANDVVSCQLRPINPADYSVRFTSDQSAELEAVFPQGVCNWSLGDASKARHQGAWISFGPSPVNRL